MKQQIGLHEISDIDDMKIMTYMRDFIVRQGTVNVTESKEEEKWEEAYIAAYHNVVWGSLRV